MSGGNLRLQVILQALDQASAPLRRVMSGSRGLTGALQQQQSTLRRLNAAQRDISAYRQQQQAVGATERAHAQAQNRVAALARQIAEAGTPTRRLNQQFSQARAEARKLKDQHQQQAVELQRLRTGLDRAGISTRQLSTHERQLRTDIAATNAQMERQRQRLAALDASAAHSRRIHAAGMNAAAHGTGAALAGAAALRTMAFPVGQAMGFESAMADVKKVVNFDTPEQFQLMNKDVLDLSMRLPMAAEEIATLVAAAGQANIPRQELLRFAEDAAKMGVAFDSTAEDAGQTMATWRTAFRLNQEGVVELADKINYLGNTGPANVNQISAVVNRIGALGEVAGLSTGPLAALGATVAGMGIQEEVAATGIKNLLLRMNAGAAATKAQQKAFTALGLDSVELAKAMQVDAKGTILDLLERIKKLKPEDQTSTLQQIFGAESIGALAPLLNNTELLAENFNKVADASNYAGSMQDEYIARVGTSENALQLLKNTGNALAISIGQTLLPEFKLLAERTGEIVKRVVDWTRENPQLTAGLAKAAIAGTALVTVLGGLLVAGGVGAMAFSQLHKAAMLLSGGNGLMHVVKQALSLGGRAFPMLLNGARLLLPVLGGISLPVLAIGAAIGVVAALVWKYWGPIKAFLIGTWEGVLEAVSPIMGELMTALEPLGPVWEAVADAMGSAWNWVKQLFAPFQATTEQLDGASSAGKGFGKILGTVLTMNLRMAVKTVGWIIAAFTGLGNVIGTLVGAIVVAFQGMWEIIAGLFTGNWQRVLGGFQTLWDNINQLLGGWPARMMQAGVDMVTGLINGIKSMLGSAGEAISSVGSGVIDRFKGVLGIHSPSRVFAQLGNYTMQGLATGLGDSQKQPLQQLDNLGQRMRQAGAGIALGAALPVMATAAPVAAPGGIASAGTSSAGASSYTIHIHPPAGADNQAIAQMVRQAIEQHEREKASRHRSRLAD